MSSDMVVQQLIVVIGVLFLFLASLTLLIKVRHNRSSLGIVKTFENKVLLGHFNRNCKTFLVLFIFFCEVLVWFFVFVVRFQILYLFRHKFSPQIALIFSISLFERIVVKSIQYLQSLHLRSSVKRFIIVRLARVDSFEIASIV